jgi:hypothetical protein
MEKTVQHKLLSSVEIPAGLKSSGLGEPDEISLKELIIYLKDWFKYLLSKWLLLVVAGIIGGAIGFAYSYFKKTVYTAELTFVLENSQSGGALGSYAGIAGQFGFDLGNSSGGGAFEGENLLALMKSRSMIEKALLTTVPLKGKRQTLAEFYIDMNGLREDWEKEKSELKDVRFLPDANPSKFSLEQNGLIGSFHGAIIENNLSVDKPDKQMSIISVKVKSQSDLFSKYFTEILVKEVSDFYIATKIKKASENFAILKHQTDSVRQAYNLAVTGVAITNDNNPNPNRGRQILQVPSERRQFDVQVNQAMLAQLVQNLEMARVSLRKETPLIQIIDRPVLPLPKKVSNTFRGLIFGGIIGGFLAALILIFKKFLGSVL